MRKATTLLGVGLVIAVAVASGCNLAQAENCPGNPEALGTTRVLAIDPREYPRVGAMDHAVALPLSDKEVVLTFDDGRMTSTALFQSNSRHSRRPMRQGDIFPGRRNGSCAPLNSAPDFR
jgi:hypothetical protein